VKIAAVVLLVLVGAILGLAQQTQKPGIAMIFTDISGKDQATGEDLRASMQRVWGNSARFDIVNRESLSAVLRELALVQSGVVSTTQAQQNEFRQANVEFLLIGKYTLVNKQIKINFEILQLNGKTMYTAPTYTYDSTALESYAQSVLLDYTQKFPIEGKVIEQSSKLTTINIGKRDGVNNAIFRGGVVKRQEADGNRFAIGTFTLGEVQDTKSFILVKPFNNQRVQPGDLVLVGAADAIAGTASTPTDVGFLELVRETSKKSPLDLGLFSSRGQRLENKLKLGSRAFIQVNPEAAGFLYSLSFFPDERAFYHLNPGAAVKPGIPWRLEIEAVEPLGNTLVVALLAPEKLPTLERDPSLAGAPLELSLLNTVSLNLQKMPKYQVGLLLVEVIK
jgi:hypothetical protein